MGDPNSWMVNFMETPNLKWMIAGDTLSLGNFHVYKHQ